MICGLEPAPQATLIAIRSPVSRIVYAVIGFPVFFV
jgi:uncharacterized membrane protein YuzA (DUF378 family)